MPEPFVSNDNQLVENIALPFMLRSSGIRGRFIRLNSTVNHIITGHAYPDAISRVLSEVIVFSSMIGSTLKMKGIVSVQAQGSNAVRFIMADYTKDGHLRGYASLADDIEKYLSSLGESPSIKALLEKGHLMISIENELSAERFQGIVEVQSDTFSECIIDYFNQSVQRDTHIITAVTCDMPQKKSKKYWSAGGVMLQKTPPASHEVEIGQNNLDMDDEWRKNKLLIDTLSAEEITDINVSMDTVLYRLFHDQDVIVYQPEKLHARCRCSEEKILHFLKTVPIDEIDSLLNDEGLVTVTCQFCSKIYNFDTDTIISS